MMMILASTRPEAIQPSAPIALRLYLPIYRPMMRQTVRYMTLRSIVTSVVFVQLDLLRRVFRTQFSRPETQRIHIFHHLNWTMCKALGPHHRLSQSMGPEVIQIQSPVRRAMTSRSWSPNSPAHSPKLKTSRLYYRLAIPAWGNEALRPVPAQPFIVRIWCLWKPMVSRVLKDLFLFKQSSWSRLVFLRLRGFSFNKIRLFCFLWRWEILPRKSIQISVFITSHRSNLIWCWARGPHDTWRTCLLFPYFQVSILVVSMKFSRRRGQLLDQY